MPTRDKIVVLIWVLGFALTGTSIAKSLAGINEKLEKCPCVQVDAKK